MTPDSGGRHDERSTGKPDRSARDHRPRKGGSPPPPGSTGLYHAAILYPDRPTLADALKRLIAAGHPLDGASDHGVSEALYLRDPDGNGLELYRDRPRAEWPLDVHGELMMISDPLDLELLLSEAPSAPA